MTFVCIHAVTCIYFEIHVHVGAACRMTCIYYIAYSPKAHVHIIFIIGHVLIVR